MAVVVTSAGADDRVGVLSGEKHGHAAGDGGPRPGFQFIQHPYVRLKSAALGGH